VLRRQGSVLRRPWVVLLALVAVAVVVAGAVGYDVWSHAQHLTKLEEVPAGSVLPVPPADPFILIVLENKTEADIRDAINAPAIKGLIAHGAVLTDYQAVAHPSQPNYLALFSGSTQRVIDDEPHDLSAPTLADQLEAAGKTWRFYAEDLPADGCFTGALASNGPDGPGTYARKHVPAMSFTAITGSPARCANVQPLSAFSPHAADFIWVVPNLCHDMHDCSVADGDAWLSSFLPKVTADPAFQPGGRGVLAVTFDEGDDHTKNNEIVTILDSPLIPAGTRSNVAHSHYSMLRTIETALGLPCLGEACNANTIGEVFAH
jgi:phosphatidylinositol-3-phosphatase